MSIELKNTYFFGINTPIPIQPEKIRPWSLVRSLDGNSCDLLELLKRQLKSKTPIRILLKAEAGSGKTMLLKSMVNGFRGFNVYYVRLGNFNSEPFEQNKDYQTLITNYLVSEFDLSPSKISKTIRHRKTVLIMDDFDDLHSHRQRKLLYDHLLSNVPKEVHVIISSSSEELNRSCHLMRSYEEYTLCGLNNIVLAKTVKNYIDCFLEMNYVKKDPETLLSSFLAAFRTLPEELVEKLSTFYALQLAIYVFIKQERIPDTFGEIYRSALSIISARLENVFGIKADETAVKSFLTDVGTDISMNPLKCTQYPHFRKIMLKYGWENINPEEIIDEIPWLTFGSNQVYWRHKEGFGYLCDGEVFMRTMESYRFSDVPSEPVRVMKAFSVLNPEKFEREIHSMLKNWLNIRFWRNSPYWEQISKDLTVNAPDWRMAIAKNIVQSLSLLKGNSKNDKFALLNSTRYELRLFAVELRNSLELLWKNSQNSIVKSMMSSIIFDNFREHRDSIITEQLNNIMAECSSDVGGLFNYIMNYSGYPHYVLKSKNSEHFLNLLNLLATGKGEFRWLIIKQIFMKRPELLTDYFKCPKKLRDAIEVISFKDRSDVLLGSGRNIVYYDTPDFTSKSVELFAKGFSEKTGKTLKPFDSKLRRYITCYVKYLRKMRSSKLQTIFPSTPV